MPDDDDQAFPASDGQQIDDEIQDIARDVEERLARFASSDVARRKLVTLLTYDVRTAASERLALRARKFAEQAGRCAHCFQPFGAGLRPAPMHETVPLLCGPCNRNRLLGRKRAEPKKT